MDGEERNEDMSDYHDVLYMDADHIVDASRFSTLIQVESIISRVEYGHTTLGREAHNLSFVTSTSQATLNSESAFRQSSRTLSAIRSQSLSGCPSVTDSAA